MGVPGPVSVEPRVKMSATRTAATADTVRMTAPVFRVGNGDLPDAFKIQYLGDLIGCSVATFMVIIHNVTLPFWVD